jgi:transposase
MTITTELETNILRYHYVEKWKVGTIATQLHVHRSVVKRVLEKSGVPIASLTQRKSILDEFMPFVLHTLKKYPNLTASRLYTMVFERGYRGRPDHFRHLIALHRPRPTPEAYLRLRTLPGEQGQVDWGHFGHILIGNAKRPVMAFVMVLSFSRKIFLRFYLNQRMSNFLRGHEAAFQAWGGVPRIILSDNLKSAVLERQGDAIHFHPTYLEFAGHYHFEPRPVAVARGNEKGRVERAIRYVRDNFFAGRTWKTIDELNQQATEWCEGIAANRVCPEDQTRSVGDVFLEEKPRLLQLPENPYPVDEREEVSVGKTPYVRFDLNDYSVPHTYVRRTLTVCATLDKVSIIDGSTVIAEHSRSDDKGKQIEQESHIAELTAEKRHARQHRGQDRLAQAIPLSGKFLSLAVQRGYRIRTITANLLEMLDDYGAVELEAAMAEALSRDVPHPNAVRISLEKRREQRKQLPLVRLDLPDDARIRNIVVRPHDLNDYDKINEITTLEENNHED